MSQHQYFSIHLLLYSIRAMGLTTGLLNYQRFILLVVVEMVPILPPAPPGGLTQRLAIRQLLSVPIHIIPDKVRNEYIDMVNQIQKNRNVDAVHGHWITTNGIYVDGDDWRYRLWVGPLERRLLEELRRDTSYSFPIQSLSFGREQRLRLDLESLLQ
jgi:hypothetical protein